MGDGPFDTPKERAEEMQAEYEYKLCLARKLYRHARAGKTD